MYCLSFLCSQSVPQAHSLSTLTHIVVRFFNLSLSIECHICYEILLTIKTRTINDVKGGLEIQK